MEGLLGKSSPQDIIEDCFILDNISVRVKSSFRKHPGISAEFCFFAFAIDESFYRPLECFWCIIDEEASLIICDALHYPAASGGDDGHSQKHGFH